MRESAAAREWMEKTLKVLAEEGVQAKGGEGGTGLRPEVPGAEDAYTLQEVLHSARAVRNPKPETLTSAPCSMLHAPCSLKPDARCLCLLKAAR